MTRRMLLFSPFLFLLFPISVSAQNALPAGFPPGSLWLSKNNPVEGEIVTIFTALYNGSEAAIRGTITFFVDAKSLVTKEFELGAGETELISAPWKAIEGKHAFSANIESATDQTAKEVVTVTNAKTSSLSVSVSSPPPPPPQTPLEQNTEQLTEFASAVASSSIPALETIFEKAEALRKKGSDYFEHRLAENMEAEKQNSFQTASSTSSTSLLDSAERYFNTAGALVFRSAVLFYPLFAVLFLFLLRRMYRYLSPRT